MQETGFDRSRLINGEKRLRFTHGFFQWHSTFAEMNVRFLTRERHQSDPFGEELLCVPAVDSLSSAPFLLGVSYENNQRVQFLFMVSPSYLMVISFSLMIWEKKGRVKDHSVDLRRLTFAIDSFSKDNFE